MDKKEGDQLTVSSYLVLLGAVAKAKPLTFKPSWHHRMEGMQLRNVEHGYEIREITA